MEFTLEFPNEFVQAVKEAFPDSPSLHQALDNGNENVVGRALCDAHKRDISLEHMLSMLSQGKFAELLTEGQRLLRARQLYREWCEMFRGATRRA